MILKEENPGVHLRVMEVCVNLFVPWIKFIVKATVELVLAF